MYSVKDYKQFSHTSRDNNFEGLALFEKTIGKVMNSRITTNSGQCGPYLGSCYKSW